MNAYNPLTATKRLDAAGRPRQHAEAIAFELDDGTSDLVTNPDLDKALTSLENRILVRMGVVMAAIVGLACTIMSVVISLK